MRKTVISLAALLALTVPAAAQNINQSVQVTNDYLARFADFQKLGGAMQVPDSLLRFDYKFDYSVFDTPYRGSYEFSPYRIQATPAARLSDAGTLYLRAGAGYTLHPQLELAWRVLDEENFKIGVTADAGGYAGTYLSRGGAVFSGHDLWGRAALDGTYLTPGTRLSYRFGYENILAGEDSAAPGFQSGFHSAVLAGRVQSRPGAGGRFIYDANLRYRYSGDHYPKSLGRDRIGENSLHAGISAGTDLDERFKVLLDAALDLDARREYGEMFNGTYAAFVTALTPHVQFVEGPVRLDVGLRADFGRVSGSGGRFSLAPAVTARMDVPDYGLELYAIAGGGQAVQGHYDLKQVNHFAFRADVAPYVSQEKLSLRAGVSGQWLSSLQYGLEAGFADYAAQPLLAWDGVGKVDYKALWLQGSAAWRDDRIEADGVVRASHSQAVSEAAAFLPALLTADLRGIYNWQKRIFAGAYVQASTSRRSLSENWSDLPGYADLGLLGEYRFNARWTAWAQAGNLLGMAIERVPGYIEKSPYLTIGFSLKL